MSDPNAHSPQSPAAPAALSQEKPATSRDWPAIWSRVRVVVMRVLPLLLVLLPVAAMARLIYQHAVNIPFLDDWMFVQMDEKAANPATPLTLNDYFIVQMEHRMAFVRAVIMLCHHWFPGNYVIMMWISFAMLVGTALNVFLLLRRSTEAKFAHLWPVLALVTFVIFSPVQYQIVLWPMMFQVAALAFFLTTSLVFQLAPRPLWLRFLVGITCAACATLSFATGIMLWLLPLPLLFLPGVIRSPRARWIYVALWLIVFGVSMKLYFTDLHNETNPQFSYKQQDGEETMGRNISAFLKEPFKATAFIFRLLGCHLARGTSISAMDASLVIGGVSVLIWLAAAVFWFRRYSDERVRRMLLPWLLLGAYSIGAAGLISLGRVWATGSGENAITSRYVIHAVPLTVSLIVLVWLIARELRRTHPHARQFLVQTLTASAFVLITLQGISWVHGMRLMSVWESSRLRGAANVLFYNTVHNAEGDIAGNRKLARIADSLGLLDPPMLKNARLDNFRLVPKLLARTTAQFRELRIEQGEDEKGIQTVSGVARGFASLPGRHRVADAVLFTYRVPADGHWEIFHVAQVKGLPMYLLHTISKDMQFIHLPIFAEEGVAGFEARFDLRQLPPGEHEIMAWALDYRQMAVFPMAGIFHIDPAKPHVKKLGTDPKSVHLQKFLESASKREESETRSEK